MTPAEKLETMLAAGVDTAVLRFTLGSKYLEAGEIQRALEHLLVAVNLDPDYSAAWKVLGKAQGEAGLVDEALETNRQGDLQAAREMEVFRKRL